VSEMPYVVGSNMDVNMHREAFPALLTPVFHHNALCSRAPIWEHPLFTATANNTLCHCLLNGLAAGHEGCVNALSFSSDGQYLFTTGRQEASYINRVPTCAVLHIIWT
jgi:hypothetical protein